MSKKIIISCSSPISLLNFRGKLIEELVKHHHVFVFTPQIDDDALLLQIKDLGVTVFQNRLLRNNVSVLGDLKYSMQLRRIIKQVKPDIFFAYTFKPIIFGSLVASLSNVKQIVSMLTGLGYNFTAEGKNSVVSKITRRLLKISLNSSKRVKVIFQNEDDYNELLNYRILSARNQAYIVNGSGVDLSRYQYSVPDVQNIVFLMMARLINAKGVAEYYEAAKQLKAKYPRVRFVLIGPYDGTGTDSIDQDTYQKIASQEIVEYHGWINDVRPMIRASSVVVLPSYYREGIPRSVQEGMAIGRAIITTNAVGCKETLNPDLNRPNGFLIPVKDVAALAQKMEYFITHPEKILSFGINGRKFCEEKFDVQRVNQHMLQIMELGSV